MNIDLPDAQTFEAIASQASQHGGAMVPRPNEGEVVPLAIYDFSLRVGGSVLVEIPAQVVHIGEDALALVFTPEAVERFAEVDLPAPLERDDHESDEEHDEEGAATELGSPAWKRYESMTKAEKLRLAKFGNATERRLVLRDKDASLHLQVLNNPGLKPAEIARLIRGGGASGAFVKRVAERADLLGNTKVAEALVFSPSTPTPTAVNLVARLPITTVKRIAKSGNLKQQIVQAARKRVLR